MLVADAITKSYGPRRVLDRIEFVAHTGYVTGLLGPNGAGKSTLLHIIVGLTPQTSGRISVDRKPGHTPQARRSIGFCPDDLPMPDLLTAREYLALVQGSRGITTPREAIMLMAEGLRLAEHLDALIGTYSHGMKRKLQLIAALLHAPTVLILDEPFRGLDPESAAIMRALITQYAADGRTVLFSTHDLLLAQRLCQDVVVLADGRVQACGTVDEVVGEHPDLEASFLAQTGLRAAAERAAAEFLVGLELVGASRA